jgi:hypothetical protein
MEMDSTEIAFRGQVESFSAYSITKSNIYTGVLRSLKIKIVVQTNLK